MGFISCWEVIFASKPFFTEYAELLPRKGTCFCSPPGDWHCSFKGIVLYRKTQNLNKDPLIIWIYLAAYQSFKENPQYLAVYPYIYELKRPVIPVQAAAGSLRGSTHSASYLQQTFGSVPLRVQESQQDSIIGTQYRKWQIALQSSWK